MLNLYHHVSLLGKTTFNIRQNADFFLEFDDSLELINFLSDKCSGTYSRCLVMGSGSNLLFTRDFHGLIIRPMIEGVVVVKEDERFVWVEAGAGVIWDSFVKGCVLNGWWGIENLSYIPGTVGAAPVQNIGAYGVEVGSVIEAVRGVSLKELAVKELPGEECCFSYRDSIFKAGLKDEFVITSVIFRLSKVPNPCLDYEGLKREVEGFGEVSLCSIRDAVVDIRKSKLPDFDTVGSAGSFFKNPTISTSHASSLRDKYPHIPLYYVGENGVKVAAGWLIEQTGWKGKALGDAAVHDKQALILVNRGGATGKEIFELSERIRGDVLRKFEIELEREVSVV